MSLLASQIIFVFLSQLFFLTANRPLFKIASLTISFFQVTLAGSFVEFVTLNVSAFIVTVLCFTRYISVKHPFIIIKRRVVIISVICYTMFCLVVLGCRMVIVHGQPCGMDESKTCPIEFIYIGEKEYELREVEHVLRIIAMATLPLCGTISFIFSILTILALKQSDSISTTGRTRTVTKKSCITIGIINFFNVLYCIVVLICVSMMERYAKADGTDQAKYRREGFMVSSFYFLGMRLFPMCLSALNPLIILVRCKEMRDTLREGVKKMCHCKGEDTVPVPPSRLSHPTFRHTVA